jgi:hypothetical protein
VRTGFQTRPGQPPLRARDEDVHLEVELGAAVVRAVDAKRREPAEGLVVARIATELEELADFVRLRIAEAA